MNHIYISLTLLIRLCLSFRKNWDSPLNNQIYVLKLYCQLIKRELRSVVCLLLIWSILTIGRMKLSFSEMLQKCWTMYYSILLTMLLIQLGVQSFLLYGKGQLVLALLVGMPTFSAIALYGSLRWPHQPITRFLNTYEHILIKQIFHSVKKEVRHLMLQARAFVSHT